MSLPVILFRFTYDIAADTDSSFRLIEAMNLGQLSHACVPSACESNVCQDHQSKTTQTDRPMKDARVKTLEQKQSPVGDAWDHDR